MRKILLFIFSSFTVRVLNCGSKLFSFDCFENKGCKHNLILMSRLIGTNSNNNRRYIYRNLKPAGAGFVFSTCLMHVEF